jgi:predicted O-methyltransferase YrrM
VQTLRGALNFTHVGRLEDFSGIVRTFLAHCGNSALESKAPMNRMPGSSHYDQAIADRVYELYQRDFTAFDYAKDSYPRASAPTPQTVPESSFIDEVLERNLMINLLYDERDRLAERVRDLEKATQQEVSSGHAPAIPAEAQRGMGFDELFDRYISRIDGWLTREEAAYLYGLAKQAAEGCIAEVGNYRGRSTAALAFGTNAGARLPVYAVEPHEKFRGVFGGEFWPSDRGCFMRAMAETGLYEHVRLVNVSSEFLSDDWPMPASMLYIDGDHRYESVKRDFECWRGKLAPNALVVFDDAANPSTGPGQLSREIVNSGAFVLEPAIGKMVCLKRKSAA